MNIQEAKTEICNTLRAYLAKGENGYYTYPLIRQRPLLLIGPPGIGKTAIMEQAAAECGVGLVAYSCSFRAAAFHCSYSSQAAAFHCSCSFRTAAFQPHLVSKRL